MNYFLAVNDRQLGTCLRMLFAEKLQPAVQTVLNEKGKIEFHISIAADQEVFEELNGEAGEAIDILKKHLFQGHELDTAHMAKELGDVAWYLAVSANAIGYDLETIMQMNVDKLKARYPDGFDAEHSLHRDQDDI